MICWKIRIFAYWTTPKTENIQIRERCDLLKNSYLCLLNNTRNAESGRLRIVVICWKIRIFAYWTTPPPNAWWRNSRLWFAEKFVSLLIEQHQNVKSSPPPICCDLLKNSYLCLLNNTNYLSCTEFPCVVICWKIRIFAYWTTPSLHHNGKTTQLWFAEKFVSLLIEQHQLGRWCQGNASCDLLKNSYLCLLNNTNTCVANHLLDVVICWKIRIFAYWTTPICAWCENHGMLWFAEKFVSLLIEQHHILIYLLA